MLFYLKFCKYSCDCIFQSLQTEIENHEPRIFNVVEVGQKLIDEKHPQSEEFQALIDELMKMWDDLRQAIVQRDERLKVSDTAQQVGDSHWDVKYSV